MASVRTLETLQFDNSFARLPEVFHAKVTPTPLKNPFLVSFNQDAAALIELSPEEAGRPEFAGCFGGQYLLPGSEPIATVYAGHQFGAYVSRLGDGRAILLGEVRNSLDEKWDLHLKGAGLTPFSRDDDGRAVLRSCIREYLCSEAMHGLGIPSTRALCVVGSEEEVLREQVEPGATMLRLAPSHVRFGHFEFFYWRRQFDHLKTLTDYVIARDYPNVADLKDTPVAAEFARRLLGATGGAVISGAIAISTFGALNGNLLVGPRLLYAMGQDGLAPRALSRLHRRFQTPAAAEAVLTGWSIALVVACVNQTLPSASTSRKNGLEKPAGSWYILMGANVALSI